MRRLFVDSFYYIALLNEQDAYHERAQTVISTIVADHVWTTDLVLIEVADALSAPGLRSPVATALRKLAQARSTTIVHLTPDLFDHALSLYEQRPDKEWSLTDCLSFVVMRDNNIGEALTGDRHFEQAGFRALLREDSTP